MKDKSDKNIPLPIHKIELLDGSLMILPKKLGEKRIVLVFKLPKIKDKTWHFTIIVEINEVDKIFYINAHWTDEITKRREFLLEIELDLKRVENFFEASTVQYGIKRFFKDKFKSISSFLSIGNKIFKLYYSKKKLLMFYAPSEINEMIKYLTSIFPYIPQKKKLIVTKKPLESAKKILKASMIFPQNKIQLKEGIYIVSLIHKETRNLLDLGILSVNKEDNHLIGQFILKPLVFFVSPKLFIESWKIFSYEIIKMVEAGILKIRYKEKQIKKEEIQRFLLKQTEALKVKEIKTFITLTLETYFWHKGFKVEISKKFKWGETDLVAYKRGKKVIVIIGTSVKEIKEQIDLIKDCKKKYRPTSIIWIVSDVNRANEILKKTKIKNVRIKKLSIEKFLKLYFKTLGIKIKKKNSR